MDTGEKIEMRELLTCMQSLERGLVPVQRDNIASDDGE